VNYKPEKSLLRSEIVGILREAGAGMGTEVGGVVIEGFRPGIGAVTRATNSALVTPGYRVTYLLVDREGLLNLADLEAAITDETAVVSLMWANNETGVLFPVESIAEICRSRGVLYHCNVCAS